jgi:hypothetical protein
MSEKRSTCDVARTVPNDIDARFALFLGDLPA